MTLAKTAAAAKGSDTQVLAVLHLPIALWLMAIGVAYVGGRWFSSGRRMDFVRFSGELAIYYVLIALGGGVVTGFTAMLFSAIDMNPGWFIGGWLIPCGAAGAVIIGSWLVEAKQSVIENMAPVLTRLFTPLFTVLLLAFLATMAWTGSPINVKREVLIGFDLLLVLVVGLVLYAASARDPQAPPDFFDGLQLLLVVSALVVDVVALTAIWVLIRRTGGSVGGTRLDRARRGINGSRTRAGTRQPPAPPISHTQGGRRSAIAPAHQTSRGDVRRTHRATPSTSG